MLLQQASDSSCATLQITSHKFNGKNFLQWSTSVQMVIRGRGKLGYLDGSKSRPNETDPSYQIWDAENSIVMAWLINSMNEDISPNFMLYPTAKSMWDAVRRRYSDLENSTQMCDLRDTARNLKQGDLSVTQYFNTLTTLWQELDMFNNHNWKCQEDAALYKSIVEKERIYDFVSGLNKDLDEVRGRTLALKPLPHIDEIFAEVRREEFRKQKMLGSKDSIITDNSAMAAYNQSNFNTMSRTGRKSGSLWCDHCNRPHHTRETCWKLHGKP